MAAGQWEYLRWAFLGQPKADRRLYRLVKRHRVTRIVELGMGTIERATRLIRVGQRYADGEPIAYAGLDWFEERPAGMPEQSLIETHRVLKATGAEVRLMPGGPAMGLPGIANALTDTELLLIAPEADDALLESAWFYLPRMLKSDAVILRGVAVQGAEGEEKATQWTPVALDEIESHAKNPSTLRAA